YGGRAYYDQDMYAEAIGPLSRALSVPGTAFLVPASYYLGRSRFETEDYAGAIFEFRRVMANEPDGLFGDNSQDYLGRCRYKIGDLPGAAIELKPFELKYPSSEYLDSVRYYLGRSYYDRDMFADALGPFTRLAVMETTLRDDGLFYAGRSFYETGDLPHA